MSEPTTETGRRMYADIVDDHELDPGDVVRIEAEAREQVLISGVEALRLRDEYTDPFEAGRATGHHEAGKYGEFKRADLAKRIEELEAVIREVLDSNALDGDDLLWLDKKCRLVVGRDWPYLSAIVREEADR